MFLQINTCILRTFGSANVCHHVNAIFHHQTKRSFKKVKTDKSKANKTKVSSVSEKVHQCLEGIFRNKSIDNSFV